MVSVPSLLALAAAPLVVVQAAQPAGVTVTPNTAHDDGIPGDALLRGGSRDLATWNFWEGKMAGYGTFFHGMGWPFGACGVPQNKAIDDNGKPLPWVALNVNSQWHNGGNCGRWIEITLGQNCEMGGNDQWTVCNNGWFENDDFTGKVIYGYVMDSCNDANFWCQNDPYHLDISEPYLNSIGLREGSTFAARKLHWNYINYVPNGWTMNAPKFSILEGSRSNGYEFWVSVMIRNTKNGVGRVEQEMPWGWEHVHQLTNLGSVYELKNPEPQNGNAWTESINLRIWGMDNDYYGAWKIQYPCGRGVCHPSLEAPIISKIG